MRCWLQWKKLIFVKNAAVTVQGSNSMSDTLKTVPVSTSISLQTKSGKLIASLIQYVGSYNSKNLMQILGDQIIDS